METLTNQFFEFSLFSSKSFFGYFLSLKEYAKQHFSNCCILTYNEKNKCYLFAIDSADKSEFLLQLEKQIVKYILTDKKMEFLMKNIHSLNKLGKMKLVFLKTLSMFDEEQDILDIQKNLRFNSCLYLDEFFLFKLKDLQKKWLEICNMTNENSFFFDADGLVFELLRYLLKNIKPKDDFLKLEKVKTNVIIKDKNNKQVFVQSLTDFESDTGINVALKILENLPKRIYLENSFPQSKATENLVSIFKNNLKIVDYA